MKNQLFNRFFSFFGGFYFSRLFGVLPNTTPLME